MMEIEMPRGVYARKAPDEGIPDPQSAEIPIEKVALSQRATETRRERRRRDDGDIDRMARLSLAIPRETKERAEREGKVLRWFLNKPGRLAEAHDDDWDAVSGIAQVAAGQEDEEKLVLMEKFKDWHDEDESSHLRDLKAREQALVAGTSRENRKDGDELIASGDLSKSLPRNRISRDRG